MLEIDIGFYFLYGFVLTILVGFLPIGLSGAWHTLKMI